MQYFVIRVDPDECRMTRDQLNDELRKFNVFARRYFYPLCSEHRCYQPLSSAAAANLPVATRVSREVLALPFYGMLGEDGASRIVDIIDSICRAR
ncbi:DegT/DnrJ/EryC1/StrS family aminotransferase [Mycetohabitans rhizoxinica]|uniref:DegT/DnrJ/EryC1/StrS family aminotransferase n=1 Tax=Mycetohabitans rhizoxinica TaxID=412963 RepID=UPI0030CD71EA